MFSLKFLKLCIYLSLPIIVCLTCPAAESLAQPVDDKLYYTVKKGDTLWDLSDRFLKNNLLWPGFWGMNTELTNPHRIFPGQRLKLEGRETSKIQPPQVPITRKAPPTIIPSYYYSKINIAGFITDRNVESSGTIIGTREGNVMISQGDLAYIKPSKSYLPVPGERHVIFRKIKPAGMYRGNERQYYLTGILIIMENEPPFVVARVMRSYRDIKTGDLIMPYNEKSPVINLMPNVKDLSGRIICSQEQSAMFGEDDIAFIDKGKIHGVMAGQEYTIFEEKKVPGLPPVPVEFGSMIVIATEDETATVLITDSDRSIHPGEKFKP